MTRSRPVLLAVLGEPRASIAAAHGDYVAWFRAAWGRPLEVHDGRRGGPLPDPRAFAGILLTGSPASLAAGAAASWMDDAADLVRRAFDAGTPTLGVCFGHQLIARAFGASVIPSPRGWELGTRPVALTEDGRRDLLFHRVAIDRPLAVHETHRDVVDPDSLRGAAVRVLGRNDHADVQALAVGEHVRGVQFHPEMTGAIVRAHIAAVREAIGDAADPALATTTDSADGVAVLQNFRRLFVEGERPA